VTPQAQPVPFPSIAEVDRIGAHSDPIVRNLQITQCYHELSAAVVARIGVAANWCTFATWASKQAGQTIRREDIRRKLGDDLGDPQAFDRAVSRVRRFVRTVDPSGDVARTTEVVRRVLLEPVLDRTSDAAARGNRKVFNEIGREFARFLEFLAAREPGSEEEFCQPLRLGEPPDGQDLLRGAFACCFQALQEPDAKKKAELILLASLRIGLHEQTRLQPEIQEALEAAVPDPATLKRRLIEALFPNLGWVARTRLLVAGLLRRTRLLDEAAQDLVQRLRQRVRAVLTEHMMTIDLPSGRLRLGADVTGGYPEHLETVTDPELDSLWRRLDLNPAGGVGSGAADWADLTERMHFIAELFRARQEDRSLLAAPFSPAQAEEIRAGRIPARPL
jgi:hypothetical protein